MRLTMITLLAILASCATPAHRNKDDLELRLSAGAVSGSVTAETVETFFGQPYVIEEKFDGTTMLGRVEIGKEVEDRVSFGGYFDFGSTDYEDNLDAEHFALGGIGRYHLLDGSIRPYVEGRLGYRGTWIGEVYGDGFDTGVALGVDMSLTRRMSTFLQVGYDFGTSNAGDLDSDFDGVSVMIGGSVRL